MTAGQWERLQESLSRLRLFKSRERLEALLQAASSEELSYADFLDRLLGEDVNLNGEDPSEENDAFSNRQL